jgi:hypothetical protein
MDGRIVAPPRKWLSQLKTQWPKKEWHKPEDSTLTFLQLPVDVMYLIFDELPLYTKVFLSQTCRPLQNLLRDDWTRFVQSLSPSDYFDFISGIADVLPEYVTCWSCGTVHAINTRDVPYVRWVRNSYPCRDWAQLRSHDFGIRYRLSYQHVQLTLKYSRLQPSQPSVLSCRNVYDYYLSRLLWPFTTRTLWYGRVEINFSAQPKVIDERFILHSQWEFKLRPDLETVAMKLEDIRPTVICPHLNLALTSNPLLQSNPMVAMAVSAFDNLGKQSYGSCTRCATDYSISALPTGVTIKAWQDLGNSGSPGDPYWVAQMWHTDNSQFWGPTVSHEPLSIMSAWK